MSMDLSRLMQQAQQMLDTTDNAILDAYCRRCGDRALREELADMMEKETYIGSQTALQYGLVDSIVGGDSSNTQPMMLAASAFNNIVKAMENKMEQDIEAFENQRSQA